MAHKYFDGIITNKEVSEEVDKNLIDAVNNLDSKVTEKWMIYMSEKLSKK